VKGGANTTVKCPDCGSKMTKQKGSGRFECRNPKCPVIEVRVTKEKGTLVLRDAVMMRRMRLGKKMRGRAGKSRA